jgi:hypothetical protein
VNPAEPAESAESVVTFELLDEFLGNSVRGVDLGEEPALLTDAWSSGFMVNLGTVPDAYSGTDTFRVAAKLATKHVPWERY